MADNLQTIQDSVLFLSPEELEKAEFTTIKGVPSRDYAISLDVPDAVKSAVGDTGILGGTLIQGEDYVFLEKDGSKDVATYIATLEGFYFKNLGKNQARVFVACFKRADAILPMKKETINIHKGIIRQRVEETVETVYQSSEQSYLNLVDMNPATNG